MNKIVKSKLIGASLCIILGIAVGAYAIINQNSMADEVHSYISGFSFGVISVGIYTMVIVVNALRKPNKGKELENEVKDERLIGINNTSMALTFRLCVFLEAIISIVCAFTNKMEFSKYIGFAICFQLIAYLVIYIVMKRKN